ncbi:AAA family ATPase [Pseudomonas monteilii]|uniref:AAA family ATPase n=1 Tax=Pseudomonas monteilii TaxID=76759 RepID=UPI001E54E911|nr:AAA family ATPase [Pseudomonas monteilii]MCE0931669.1 AAA family ATPase [Pseudomonas monteilii]MCE1007499.1 AAA family ATPase [Pseudomonas monteilii]WJN90172.1 AAA family ATPase [Pseudomonas monteilii]WJO34784.1 AAA family ATPase [Pseudomonas monteilii]WJR41129.1 AAA family ATPase [Pseudomonas monteilii]
MHLEHIFVENFQGLRSASLDLATPITLVAGFNGAGKSSLREAIGFALGGSGRVQHKKDYGKLVTEGEKKAQIIVSHDGAASSFSLPKGTAERHSVPGDDYLPFVLTPGAFAALDENARRALLFKLTKSSAKPDVVVGMLAKRKANKDKVEKIKPLLLSGFAAAQEQAKAYAAESRGAWKAITGEQYGSDKAEGWTFEAPDNIANADEREEVFKKHAKVQQDIENGNRFIGEQDAKRQAAQGLGQRKAELEEAAGLHDRAVAKRTTTEQDLAKLEQQLPDLQAQLKDQQAGSGGCECPACGVGLKIVGSKLELYQGLKQDTAATSTLALDITNMQRSVEMLRRTLQNDMAAVAKAEAARAELEQLKGQQAEAFDQDRYDRSIESLNALRKQEGELRAQYNALCEAADEAKNAEANTQKAAGYHLDVLEWVLIEKALAPDGIPGEILAGALQPFNASLTRTSKLTGWPVVQVSTEMEITAGGRLYQLLSESEQWRCDTLLALAIAVHSGLKLVMLDRFDVLDLPARGQLLGMLVSLAKANEIESAIVLGTLKAKPAKLPPEISAVWIEGGVAQQDQPMQQAG